MYLQTIKLLSKTDTSEMALCPSETLSLRIQPMYQQRSIVRGLQEISLCHTCYLSLSPLGAMQITRGCEVFALVINSSHPFCARTTLALSPSISIFTKNYLAHCVFKSINLMLHRCPENKMQTHQRLCF